MSLLDPEHLHNRGSDPWPEHAGGIIHGFVGFIGYGPIDYGSTPGIPPLPPGAPPAGGSIAALVNIRPGIIPDTPLTDMVERMIRSQRRRFEERERW